MEISGWILVLGTAVAIRIFLCHIVPAPLWSDDSPSYVGPACEWAGGGRWAPSAIRGPVYTGLIALILKAGGSLETLIVLQHALGVVTVGLAMLVLRLQFGRGAALPLLACGYACAVQPQPLSREHFIGNETLLCFFATAALASWFFALDRRSWFWLAASGLGAGLLALVKNILLPLPVFILASLFYFKEPAWRSGLRLAVVFVAAFLFPLAGGALLRYATGDRTPPAPQSGLLLFGRTAQFTVLSGGIEPEVKNLIRPDIEAYRQRQPKLDNNIILHQTAVPHLEAYLLERGGTHRDLDRLCRRLALEAIGAHPAAYLEQIGGDIAQLLTDTGTNKLRPSGKDLEATIRRHESGSTEQFLPAQNPTWRQLKRSGIKADLRRYEAVAKTSWLFGFFPVLLTTLALPWQCWRQRGPQRGWWLGLLGLWLFTLVLLSTVGRPLDRYLTPVFPIMFWALGATVLDSWQGLFGYLKARLNRSAVIGHPFQPPLAEHV